MKTKGLPLKAIIFLPLPFDFADFLACKIRTRQISFDPVVNIFYF
jgi:hypothetical protein